MGYMNEVNNLLQCRQFVLSGEAERVVHFLTVHPRDINNHKKWYIIVLR